MISVQNLSVEFSAKSLFDNISYVINRRDRIALVGKNGAGKSTMLKIIAGLQRPTSGQVAVPPDTTIGYLPQQMKLTDTRTVVEEVREAFSHVDRMEERLDRMNAELAERTDYESADYQRLIDDIADLSERLAMEQSENAEAEMEKTLIGLGFLRSDFNRLTSEFSGGWRMRIELAKLLLRRPDVLLLDEPTNYLDESHIEWLKRYLNDYENAFILISHDIPFLNSVINLIYHIDNGELTRYVGNYDDFMRVYEVKKAQLEAAYKKQQQEISELKDFVARNKARVATRNMAMSRQKKLDKMDVIELAQEKPKPEFRFLEARTPGKFIFETTDLVIGYDEPLSRPLNLVMERGQKIALVGANGIGKTTLLKSIMGYIKPYSGKSHLGDYLYPGYFEQEKKYETNITCIEEIWEEFPSMSQYEVRSALAKCGLMTKHIESLMKVLSGGEQAKVRLCKLINHETNLLLLDEPTNHLDVDAKDELKRALMAYKGSILLVCHEPEFYEDIVTDVWNCEEWTTKTL